MAPSAAEEIERLEQELHGKQALLQLLDAENVELKRRDTLLSHLLLYHHSVDSFLAVSPVAAACPWEDGEPPADSGSPRGGCGASLPALAPPVVPRVARGLLEDLVSHIAGGLSGVASGPSGVISHNTEAMEAARSMDLASCLAGMRDVVSEYGLLLPKCKALGPDSGGDPFRQVLGVNPRQRLVALVEEHRALCVHMLLFNPVLWHKVVTVNLVTGEAFKDPGSQYWECVLDAMQLSDEQCAVLVANTRMQVQRLQQLHSARQELLARAAATDISDPEVQEGVAQQLAHFMSCAAAVTAVHSLFNYLHLSHEQFAALALAAWPLPITPIMLLPVAERRWAARQRHMNARRQQALRQHRPWAQPH